MVYFPESRRNLELTVDVRTISRRLAWPGARSQRDKLEPEGGRQNSD